MKKIFFMLSFVWGFGYEDAFCQLSPIITGIQGNPVTMLPLFFTLIIFFLLLFIALLIFKNKQYYNSFKKYSQKEIFYKTLFNKSPYMTFFKDVNLVYTDCNSIMADEFNVSKKDLIGKKAEEIFNKDLSNIINTKDLSVIKSLKILDEEIYVKINSQYSYYHLILIPVLSENKKKVIGLTGFLKNISLEKRAFNLLIESERRFKNTFEFAAAAIAHVSLNGIILDINDTCTDFLGYSREDIINKSIRFLNSNMDHEKSMAVLKEFREKKRTHYEVDKEYIKKDKSIIWVHVTVSLVLDQNEEPDYLVVVFYNMDAQKQYEKKIENLNEELEYKVQERSNALEQTLKQLQESETRYKNMFEANHAVMFLISPQNGKITYANEAASQFYGYSKEELQDMKIWDLNVLSEEQVLIKMYSAKKDKKHFFQFKHKCAGGVIKDVEVYSGPIEIRGETQLFSIIHDVTEQVKMQNYIHFFFDVSIDLLSVIDENGYFIQVNPAWSTSLGYDLNELKLKPILEYIHESDKAIALRAVETLKETQKINDLELRIKCKDESYKWLSFNLAIISHKNLILLAARDISSHKDLEKTLIFSKQKAQEANKAKSMFLANISHEFRTPLNAVIGFSDLLCQSNLDSIQKSYLSSIKEASANLLTLINDILDLTKIEAGKLELFYSPVSLKDLFSNLKQIFILKANDKKLKFDLEIDEEFPDLILSDEARLRQILFNLIGNAIKFTDSGFVHVKALSKAVLQNEDIYDIQIKVQDSGIGIALDAQEEVFKVFNQENPNKFSKGGTGLGLSISSNLASMLNGYIDLKSTKNKGSTFSLNLRNVKIIQRISPLFENEQGKIFKRFKNNLVLIYVESDKTASYLNNVLKSWNLSTKLFKNNFELLEYKNLSDASLFIFEKDCIIHGKKTSECEKIFNNKKLSHIHKVLIEPSIFDDNQKKEVFDHFLTIPLNISKLYEICSLYFELESNENVINFKNWLNNLEKTQKIKLFNKLFLLLKEVKHLNGALHIAKVKKLAASLKKLALEYKSSAMNDYAKNLLSASESYDIQKLLYNLDAFEDITKEMGN